LRPTHPESRLLCRDQDILPNILCVSTFEPRKNHLLLLEASSILWKRGIKFTLTLAGSSGWSNSPIHEEILRVQSNFPRNLVVVENPTDEELEQCYLGSSFCVYPAIDEGFGIPVVESILFNRKIVSNPVPSLHLLSKEDYFQLDGTLETLISGISHGIQNFLGAEVRSELDLPVLGEQVYLGCQKLII
jgi:glycosyltransferase involved in cell wall biosynthesis